MKYLALFTTAMVLSAAGAAPLSENAAKLAARSPAVFAQAALGTDASYDIGVELATEGFWKSDPVLFVKRHEAQGFNFTSNAREGADTRLDGAVTYKGIPVYETKVSFGELGGVTRVELVLFATAGTEMIETILTFGTVPVAPYAVPGTDQVPESIAALIRNHDAILLRAHGALTVGSDLRTAYYRMETLEQFARITLVSKLLGGAQELSRAQVEELIDRRTSFYHMTGVHPGYEK